MDGYRSEYMVGILTGQTVSEIIWIWKFVIVSRMGCQEKRGEGERCEFEFRISLLCIYFFFWRFALCMSGMTVDL